jgi:hypothetical protein
MPNIPQEAVYGLNDLYNEALNKRVELLQELENNRTCMDMMLLAMSSIDIPGDEKNG